MRLFLTCAAAFAVSVPAVTIATAADAQVLAGRNAARESRAPRFTREERLTNLLYEAEDRLAEVNEKIATIESEAEAAGGLTSSQQRELAGLNRRREREEREIARLEAALEPDPED
jgi:parvulin-like peptidyl-prolyl isomerase